MPLSATERVRIQLIETLVQRGVAHAHVVHLSLPALGALLDETAEPEARSSYSPAPVPERRPADLGRRTPPRAAADPHPGGSDLAAALRLNASWTDVDRRRIRALAEEHGADGTRPSPDGRHVAVLRDRTVLFWVGRHRIDLPGGRSIRLSTDRPIRTSA